MAACVRRLEANGISECTSTCSKTQGSQGGSIPCDNDGDFTDDDCKGNTPRKMDCKSATAQSAGTKVGCVPEHADDPSDYDLCCPTSVNGQTSANATLTDFCNKCAACVVDPAFSEGFCTPFASGSSFDTSACAVNGDLAQLTTPNVSTTQLIGWSCAEFDDNE